MPEGQVSHRNALRLTAALAGREIVHVEAHPRLAAQRIPERLAGDRVAAAEAAGKHHLLRLASGRVLHSHLAMSGRWRLVAAGRPVARHGLWLALATDRWVAAQYHGPLVRLLEPGERIAQVDALGPDLLGAAVDPASAARRALAACDPARQVGDALMDQRVVSGIGNVYKSETCFLAGVDPWRPVGSLAPDEAAALGRIGAELLAEGVRRGGRIRTRAPAGGPGPGADRWVYGRAGRPCLRCGGRVRARGQGEANRTTYWCPGCQR